MSIAIIGFKTDYTNGKQVDWVQIAPRGEGVDKVQTWHRVKDITPRSDVSDDVRDSEHFQTMIARWDIIKVAYDAWKAGEEIPEDGVPLSAWAGVSQEQTEFLKRMKIVTVEQVAAMSDRDIEKLPFPGARKLPDLAKTFLSGRTQAEAAAELDAMREKMAVMEQMLAEYMAAESPEKRKPGRPRKDADH